MFAATGKLNYKKQNIITILQLTPFTLSPVSFLISYYICPGFYSFFFLFCKLHLECIYCTPDKRIFALFKLFNDKIQVSRGVFINYCVLNVFIVAYILSLLCIQPNVLSPLKTNAFKRAIKRQYNISLFR